MRIYTFGAAGSGTTTQGNDFAASLGLPFFDADAYFWEQSAVPFSIRREPSLRNNMLEQDIHGLESYVIGGGSLPNWDEKWFHCFDLAIFLYIPAEIRIKRLEHRELHRYGEIIFEDPQRIQQYWQFLDWCAGYDDNSAIGRTLAVHQQWIEKFKCPVLQIMEDLSTEHRTKLILSKISQLKYR